MNKMLREFTDPSNNLFQSETWAEYQEALGHKVYRVSCDENVALLVKMPLYKEKNYLYCPRGPRCKREGWHLFLRKAKEIATKENCVFVRVEPYNFPKELAKELKFKPVGKHSPLSKQFSPMDTQLLDISKRDDDLLEEMKPKWRYNIKLAYRKGVQVRFSTKLADLRKFYELSLGLKERGYTPFELEHYERMLYILSHNKNVTLVLAESEHKLLSALLVTFFW